MKLFISKMIRSFKIILVMLCFAGGFTATAQITTSSPYSQYGLGNIKGSFLPQNRAMGGIAVGLRNYSPLYNNINMANPASYSELKLTTFDIGISSGLSQLSKAGISKKTFNGTLSHIIFAIPVNKKSALSFGLTPFSELGYQFKINSSLDTNAIDQIYSGDGGLSRLNFGYGVHVGKHLSVGVNAGYLFGRLDNIRSVEFPEDPSALNSRTQKSTNITGLNLGLGIQYFTALSSKVNLTVGYAGSGGNKINASTTEVVTHYKKDFVFGDESPAADTLFLTEASDVKISIPITNSIGFSLQKGSKWLFGADFSMTNWAEYREGATNPHLQNSYSFATGGQFTPDLNGVSGYYKYIDYRFGFRHDKTYISINNTNIKETALTFGFGLPLPANRSSMYKINVAAELGQRGTLNSNLVRERFINLNIGFLLNDKWFNKAKIE